MPGTTSFSVVLGGVIGGLLALSAPLAATAQEADAPAKIDHIDRVVGGSGPGNNFRAPEGVKLVSPGALLLASFDRNFDGKVTREEITAATPGAFAVADRSKDGRISGFEQSDWAAAVGSQGDILANAMMFDANLDHSVTPDEFAKGLQRLVDEISGVQATEIAFAELLKPLSRPDNQADARPNVVTRPTGGAQVRPTVVGN